LGPLQFLEFGKGITFLSFFKCKRDFTDADLAEVAACPQLESLFFPTNSSFTDAGLAKLAGLTSLETLDLSGKGITDAGLVHLYRLKKLKRLTFSNTSITPQGIEKLKKELPDTQITNTSLIGDNF
jgi:hypothetical protein